LTSRFAHNWHLHSWSTHHIEGKYNKIFDLCKAEIEALSPGVTVTKKSFIRAPNTGAFEVTIKEGSFSQS